MPMTAADWSLTRSNGNIRYIGDDHGGTAPSYATVIEFHRFWGDLSDDEVSSGDDEHDITDPSSTDRSTDNIITLLNPGSGVTYNIDDTAAEHLYDGSIVQRDGDEIYDGVINFGNAEVVIQVHRDGAVIADDFWNYNIAGTHTGAADATVLTDSGAAFPSPDGLAGRVIRNTTDGSHGLVATNTATTITLTADGLNGGTENDFDNSDAYLVGDGLNSDSVAGISHRFMVKSRVDGVDIDQRRLIGTNRTFTKTFGEFKIPGTSRGNNVLALSDSNDLNNNTDESTVQTWTTITNTEGLRLLDISGDAADEEYYSEWNRDTFSINQFFERTKWIQHDGSSATQNGMNGELFRGLTHSFAYDGEAGVAPTTNDLLVWGTNISYDTETGGPFQVGEAIHEDTATPAWKGRVLAIDDNGVTGNLIVDVEEGTVLITEDFTGQTSSANANVVATPTAVTGGGVMAAFAVDDDGTTGNLYVQVLKGTIAPDNAILYNAQTNLGTIDVANLTVVQGTATERAIATPFVGQSTGSALIGAYGIGMEPADTTSNDTFFDLQNNQVNPPNNVTFTVFGLVSGEDRVLVTNNNAGAPDFNQMTLATALTGAAETNVNVQAASIPADTPSPTGVLRIFLDDGRKRRVPYTALPDTSNFTIASTSFVNPDDAAISQGVMLAYIDKLAGATSEAFTTVYNSDRTLFIRVRDGGVTPIKTFETTGTLGVNGGSVTAIRTSDL